MQTRNIASITPITRRDLLSAAPAMALAGAAGTGAAHAQDGSDAAATAPPTAGTDSWEGVRAHFELDPRYVHMAGLLLSSHPTPVREAIDRYRRALDEDPARYVQENNSRLKARVREAAARYMGVAPEEIALTDSTTMGTALVIMGLRIGAGQEMLAAENDYYSTREAMQQRADRSGTSMREIRLYEDIRRATEDQIVDSLVSEIRPATRLVAATWVHSATGLKMPVPRIAERIREINADRSDEERVVFFVDGVHGLGVEDTDISDLGCDFFSAGTHKWMHGPRGTGVLWGHPRVHGEISLLIPTFTHDAGWGGTMSPGGFKPFEHEWALAEAFAFHDQIGRTRIQERIHSLASQLKEGIGAMDHITLQSPVDDRLTAGIVCFDVDGLSAEEASAALSARKVIASNTPYEPSHARLTVSIFNDESDVEEALRAVRELG